ncbi:aminotransferase [Streptomyces sp. SPB78]|nr:aminotransferase [Streptomyces sp. SPB78]
MSAQAVAPRGLPPLAARAAAVKSSPVRDILAVTARPEVINFAGGLPAPEFFDVAGVAAAFAAVLGGSGSGGKALQYATTEGEPSLRAALAARTSARGLPTEADDLLVTTGSQQGLHLVTSALVEAGDTVLVESPCYLAALQVFAFAGARVVPVPCDEDGVDPDALDALAARERPKFFYSVPAFQNPTGRTTTAARRAAVAAVAARRGFLAPGGRPLRELRYEGVARCPGSRRTRAPRTARCCSAASRRSWRPACGSAGCARPRRCGAPARSSSSPLTCTRRPSTSSPPHGTWPTATSTRTWRRSPPRTGGAGTRCSPRSPKPSRTGRSSRAPRAECSCGRGSRRGPTRRSCCAR